MKTFVINFVTVLLYKCTRRTQLEVLMYAADDKIRLILLQHNADNTCNFNKLNQIQ